MATKKVKAVVKADTRSAVASMRTLRDEVIRTNKALERMGGIASKVMAAGAIGGFVATAASAAGALADLGKESIKVQAVFQNLPFSISGARDATMGLVSDMDLAKAANSAMRLGVASSADDFAKLSAAAVKLGSSVGQDAADSIDSLVGALGRGSPALLDNLGVTLKVEQAQKEYAKQILGPNGTIAGLTKQQKAEAFGVVAKQKLIEAAQGVTFEFSQASIATQRAAVELENMKNSAIGAETSHGDLKSALNDLGDDIPAIIRDWERYGAAQDQVDAALLKYGTTIEGVGGKQEVYNALVKAAGDLEQRRLDVAKAQAELEAQSAKDAKVKGMMAESSELTHQVNLMRARGDEEADIIGAQIASLQLRRDALDVETEVTAEIEAQKLALDRQIEVQNERLVKSFDRPRRGGGGRRRSGTEFDRILEDVNKKKRFGMQTSDDGRADLVAAWAEEDAEKRAREDREIAALVSFNEIMGGETEAGIAHREKLREEGEKRREKLRREIERKQAAHAQRMADIAGKVTGETARSADQLITATLAAKEKRGQVFAEELKQIAGAKAKELGIQAAVHTAKGVAFMISGNPVKGAMELSAAGSLAAATAALGATYGVAAGVAGRDGGSKSAEGPGNAFNLGGGPGGGGRADPSAPVSPLEEPLGASNPQGASSGGAAVINFNGAILDGEKLMRTIQDYERENGRILA